MVGRPGPVRVEAPAAGRPSSRRAEPAGEGEGGHCNQGSVGVAHVVLKVERLVGRHHAAGHAAGSFAAGSFGGRALGPGTTAAWGGCIAER
jgi:hypothetical protein